ncbi:hypothetical protein PEC301296_07100 [Pectobacterium carotovorum subsp. carotovorum]|nr:hypothetical protein GZ59_30780 [Pectobacterium atrosepticum]KMK88470.1 hypothetical protein KCQ_01180 [Pectobacterium atrosepticum ICMP 1526]POW31449.1 hypothetical protein PB72LOC_00873 [Pectobacterium atrosepticum]GKV84398.1 hypothetical protein PEC301296_07100 [Pectobacterium carotovorum subsp. carotovorum]
MKDKKTLYKIKIEVEWLFNNIAKLICVKKVQTIYFGVFSSVLC